MNTPILTYNKLKRFMKLRNSSRFNSNLQFDLDLNECGLTIYSLGKTNCHLGNYESFYWWDTEFGLLVEERRSGKLRLFKKENK